MANDSRPAPLGMLAPDFALPGVDGHTWSRTSVRGDAGLLVMFICNHCPYVRAVIDRIVLEAQALLPLGIGCVAISSNDAIAYPEDSFPRMREFARANKFSFPYLYDESQEIARAYGAVCTPDFFGFNAQLQLQYRGRLDASGRQPAGNASRRELFDAMQSIAATGRGPADQIASVGCSIKWRT